MIIRKQQVNKKSGNVTHYKVLLLVETTPLTKEDYHPLKFTSGNQTEDDGKIREIGYTPASPK